MKYRTTICNHGDDCMIIYHPSRGSIARARIRRYLRLRLATFRSFMSSRFTA